MAKARWLSLCTLLGAALIVTPAWSEDSSGQLTVELSGLASNQGKVVLLLYADKDGYPTKTSKAMRRDRLAIERGVSRLVIDALPHGTYAISAFHDVNDNGKLDTNFIGIPKEPVGASNNAKGKMGPPKWDDAKFVHAGAATKQSIRLRSL